MTAAAELRLRLERGAKKGVYRVVATGPGGDASGDFRNPFSALEFENFILKVSRTRQGVRRIESPQAVATKEFGEKLFAALFADDKLRDLYRTSARDAQTSGEPLRLTLSMTDTPDLLQLPWEFLYDHPSFLAISRWTPIVRYLDLPKPKVPLKVGLPLHILAIVSAPSDAEPIDARAERAKLDAALGPLASRGAVTVDWLLKPSLLSLNHKLRDTDYHVIHYIGHGGYDEAKQDGLVLFEDENGLGKRISGVQLGNILQDELSIRLVVLNSCEGSRSSLDDPFSGVASSLIERGIPAVIGMQFEITDRAAILFASEFYTALANGMPVDTAVAEARRGIYADDNDIEWGTPVLFMRVQDGQLFDVEEHLHLDPAPREALLETAAHAGLNVIPELNEATTEEVSPAEADLSAVPEPAQPEPAQLEPRRSEPPGPDVGPAVVKQQPPAWLAWMLGAPLWMRGVAGAALTASLLAGFFLFGPKDGVPRESPSATASATSIASAAASESTIASTGQAKVPNVYRWPADDAEQAIRDLGFTQIRVEDVCSNRLAGQPGVVREVLIDVGAPDGVASDPANRLVGDVGEELRSELVIDLDQPLHIKVANGHPC